MCNFFFFFKQQEARLERQEQRLHNKAVRAAVHGNIGRAVHLEVSISAEARHSHMYSFSGHAGQVSGWG